jgi:anti-sigma B factor antagonist
MTDAVNPSRSLTVTASPVFGGHMRLAVSGEIDIATVPRFTSALSAAISELPQFLVIDFAALRFLDSSAVKALVDAHRAAAAQGVLLTVVNCPPLARRILEIVGVYKMLTGEEPTIPGRS